MKFTKSQTKAVAERIAQYEKVIRTGKVGLLKKCDWCEVFRGMCKYTPCPAWNDCKHCPDRWDAEQGDKKAANRRVNHFLSNMSDNQIIQVIAFWAGER